MAKMVHVSEVGQRSKYGFSDPGGRPMIQGWMIWPEGRLMVDQKSGFLVRDHGPVKS
jgi:hypothetical protein